MIFKIDENTDCSFIFKTLIKMTELSTHNENLVKATVKNVMVAAISLSNNESIHPFLSSFQFHDFLISIVIELLYNTEQIEKLILVPKQKRELENRIMDLSDLLEYFKDLLTSLHLKFKHAICESLTRRQYS